MHQFHKFILPWNSTCFGLFLCPTTRVYSLYTQQWYMSYRFVDSLRAGPSWPWSKAVYKPIWHIPLLSVQWINSWWWTDEQSETCRVSWQNRFVKIVHLVGFIIKEFVTIHGHMNVKFVLKVLAIWEQGGTSLCKLNNSASVCTVENSWCWAEKMSETCRVLWQNKFG
jgi:hypothetical protein